MTPQQVRDLSIAGLFATISDAVIQEFIRTSSNLLGSDYARAHTQREDGVAYLAAHRLWLRLKGEGALSGGGGGGQVGVVSSMTLTGVGSMGFAVSAQSVSEINDWLQAWSPWSVDLHAIVDSFGPAVFVTGMSGSEIVA